MPTVQISETYDLSTTVNKLGLIAIHTPSSKLINRLYPGLFLNYKFMRVEKCDLAVACASVQPADPLQIGTEAGTIAPQDMFNPILYRAVSNESYNTILNRIYASDYSPENLNMNAGGSVSGSNQAGSSPFTSTTIDHYYALLGDSGWRKAMPQSGFAMTNLRPLVYSLVSTFGNMRSSGTLTSLLDNPLATSSSGSSAASGTDFMPFRGQAQPFPRLPTLAGQIAPNFTTSASPTEWANIPQPTLFQIPRTFVAVIITPPATQHVLYYRLRVVWTITFSDCVSLVERSNLSTIAVEGSTLYTDGTVVVSGSKNDKVDNPDVSTEMVDTVDVSAEMIMQR